MPIQITIIGLGQIGGSIGLALGRVKDQVTRIGCDREPRIQHQAEKMGVVDKTTFNLPSAVKDADVVILATPVDQIRETIEIIAQDLKPGVVLVSTAPVTNAVMQWAKEYIHADDRYFAALSPSLNPAYLFETNAGIEAAHADLFKNSLILISTPPGIDESAIALVTNLTQILGATPLFADFTEADGLMAYSHVLPQLVAAALVNATVNQPGWREARKIAGHAYAQATEPALHPAEGQALGQTALLNAESTVRMLDQVMIELRQIRDQIAANDTEAVQTSLEHALTARDLWWKQRTTADWEDRANDARPEKPSMFGQLFGVRQKKDKDKQQK